MKNVAAFGLLFTILTGFQFAFAVVNGTAVNKASLGSGGPEDYILGLKMESRDSNGTMMGYCTAVIIAPNALLTASHCLRNAGDQVTAVSGTNIDSGKKLSVKKIFLHPKYNRASYSDPNSQMNDVAIIQLKKNLTEPHRIVRIAEAGEALPVDQNLIVIGYGRTSLTAKSMNRPDFGKLRKGLNSIHSSLPGILVIKQDTRSGLCEGDSGGPLLQQTATGFTLWAAAQTAARSEPRQSVSQKVSASSDVGSILKANKDLDYCKAYGKYSDVRSHLTWIQQTLALMK